MTESTGDYIAQQRITPPGAYVAGYQPGDTVPASVVTNWDLSIPDQVRPADGYQPNRPADNDPNRTAWEAYVIGQGTTLDDARAASLDELRAMYDAPTVEIPAHDLPASVAPEGVDGTGVGAGATPVQPIAGTGADAEPGATAGPVLERPPVSAKKADWVAYVIAAGASESWATADDTTKTDLEAWEPRG